jgi:hypothetical protein
MLFLDFDWIPSTDDERFERLEKLMETSREEPKPSSPAPSSDWNARELEHFAAGCNGMRRAPAWPPCRNPAVWRGRRGGQTGAHSKALSIEITRAEIEQVIALAAGTIGLPATVAVFSWVADQFSRTGKRK